MPSMAAKNESLRQIFTTDDVAALVQTCEQLESDKNHPMPRAAFFGTEVGNNSCLTDVENMDTIECDTAVSITKAFLMMVLHGASQCCAFAMDTLSFQEMSSITETAGNLLHVLIIGCRARLRPPAVYDALLTEILDRESEEQVRILNEHCGHQGLRPVELAVALDEFRIAERLLCNGVLNKVKVCVCGPHIYATFDLGEYEYNSSNSRFFVSPVALLAKDLSLDRLRAIKESGILRKNSIFYMWATHVTKRGNWGNWFFCVMILMLITFSTFNGHDVLGESIRYACKYMNANEPKQSDMISEYIYLFFVVVLSMVSVPFATLVWYRWSQGLKALGYPFSFFRTRMFQISLSYYIPTLMVIPWLSTSLVALFRPNTFCGSTLPVQYVVGILTILMNTSLLYITLYSSQVFGFVSQFVSNFFDILSQFVRFLVFYIIVILVFARIFESINDLRRSHINGTLPVDMFNDHSLFQDYYASAYTTFRISLNVIDFSREYTDAVMASVHLVFVLVLPFMFFNYIIGVVSAQLSSMVEVRYERTILHQTLASSWIMIMLNPFVCMLNSCRNSNRKQHVTVCLAVTDVCLCQKVRMEIISDVH